MNDNNFKFQEPPIEPDDTRPTGVFPQVNLNENTGGPAGWQRLLGLLFLLGAFGLTSATMLILLTPTESTVIIATREPTQTEGIPAVGQAQATDSEITAPTDAPPTEQAAPQIIQSINGQSATLPTADPQTIESLLQAPMQQVAALDGMKINQNVLNPFTIIPNRPRNELIIYRVVQGDTIDEIARRFGLKPETIAWSNARRIIQVLRPGDELNIPPVDGVLINAFGTERTIADYTTLYKLDDPYLVLDSEFNRHLVGFTPETVPPTGTQIFFPGGEAEAIVWRADIEISEGGGGRAGAAGVSTVVFQPGDPGDCGPIPIGGGSFWSNPVPSGGYQISRGYSSWHPGIDLAKAEGVPIAAANGGTVIFAGWNSYGYGLTIAIIHGPNMTVYGHLSQVNVGCGQVVESGQIIGLMGNTGNSSGPHLHFEIRARSGNTYIPLNPASTIGF